MPDSFMIYKAGKISFLLVCLFLCTACGSGSKAVFKAGDDRSMTVVSEETEMMQSEKLKELETANETPEELLININTAGPEELMTLPGIGEVRAKAIVEYRNQVGEFEKIEDIMNVKGIKTGIFSKINSLICVK